MLTLKNGKKVRENQVNSLHWTSERASAQDAETRRVATRCTLGPAGTDQHSTSSSGDDSPDRQLPDDMEMTESYRQPALELSKSDFFNFVTSNEITDAQYKEQMRSVNVFMESPDSRSNPLLSEEPKEQNNNVLLSSAGAALSGGGMASTTTALQSFDSIWNADRERERLEDAMLADLTFWTQESELGAPACSTPGAKLGGDNTDGHIYTLTVQEVSDQSANRYWCKEEDVSMPSPNEIEQIQPSSLDLESILNIMPHQMNGFANDFGQDALNAPLPKVSSFNYEEAESESRNEELSGGSGSTVVKIEPFNYEDSDFSTGAGDATNESHSPVALGNTLLEGQVEFNNNNNDWKLTDQNGESNESLLRSALQGKAVIRYNPLHKNLSKIDSRAEIKRVIMNNNNKIEVQSMYAKEMTTDQIVMSLNSMQPNGVSLVLYEDSGSATGTLSSPPADNPTSTQSVDDILLSQLDSSYPEEYEKLKRIANELGESVQQYCSVDSNVYNVHQLGGELALLPAGEVQLPAAHLQLVAASAVSSSKCAGKKYKRVAKSASPALPALAGAQPSVQTATSTSNGIRKERSLHYCSICSKGFKDKYSVNVHVRTHTGEKPFSCSLCGKSFRQKAHLAKHYQTHIAQKTATANGALKSAKQR